LPARRSGASFLCQAEDGIRDFHVTGVQTCALPIFEKAILANHVDDYNRILRLYPTFDSTLAESYQNEAEEAIKMASIAIERHPRSEEHTSELQSRENLVCRLLLEKKKQTNRSVQHT